ncbi:MAG: type II secretion system protein [bacterium]
MSKSFRLKAFTLVEILLTISLFVIMLSFTLPAYVNYQNRVDLDAAVTLTAQAIRTAVTLSDASYGDTNWGVHLTTSGVTLFKGTTYATRDTTEDQLYSFPRTTTIGGINDITFSRLYGLPSQTGSITFNVNSLNTQITLNGKSQIQYQ